MLNLNEKIQIESNAKFILTSLEITKPPIPIIQVIKYSIPRSEIHFPSNMPHALKGCALFGKGEYKVFINQDYNEQCQRYTAGHELGHLLSDESGMSFDYEKGLSPQAILKERMADYYSACLLMPETIIRTYWKQYSDIMTMARIFNVSFQAMVIRLKHLRLVPWDVAEKLLFPYSLFTS